MRFLLKVNIPVEAANAAAKAGKLGAPLRTDSEGLFTDDNGQRREFS